MSNNEKTSNQIYSNEEFNSPINNHLKNERIKLPKTITSTPQKTIEQPIQLNNNLQIKISPLTPQLKYKNFLEKKELNHKFFPSKEIVCRGQNSSKTISYNQNSPIVQYYSNSNFEIFSNSDNNFTLENNQNIYIKNRESNFSTNSQNFNFSPSNIFNNKSNPNTPLIGLNNTPLLSQSGTPYLINGMIKRSLQEKIVENDNFAIESDDENDENKNDDLYRLSFNSEDLNKNNENCDNDSNENNNEKNEKFNNEDNEKSYKDNNDKKEESNLPIQSAINKARKKNNKKKEENKNENQNQILKIHQTITLIS